MKIAAPYSENDRWKNIPDEYNLPWGKKSTSTKLLNFCETIPDKRINLYTEPDVDFDFEAIVTAKKFNPNIYVRLNLYQMNLVSTLKEKEIGFYFDTTYPCSNRVILAALVSIGVSDIYIYDDLFYDLEKTKDFFDEKNIQTRMVLNKVASTSPGKAFDIRGPYVSPRDMRYLEKYIDVGEFDCGSEYYNWNKFNALYNAFYEKEEWFGDLRSLNDDIIFYYPVYSMVPDTITWKLRCRRKCSVGGRCNHCKEVIDIAKELYEEGIALKPAEEELGELEELLEE